jgi:hypothetical protein
MSRNTPDLQHLRQEFNQLKRRLAKTGFFCTGSLMSLYRRCGKSYCACHKDERRLHGPYTVWTRKVQAKTVTRTLNTKQADLCKRSIENMREIEAIVERMKELSATYIESQR